MQWTKPRVKLDLSVEEAEALRRALRVYFASDDERRTLPLTKRMKAKVERIEKMLVEGLERARADLTK